MSHIVINPEYGGRWVKVQKTCLKDIGTGVWSRLTKMDDEHASLEQQNGSVDLLATGTRVNTPTPLNNIQLPPGQSKYAQLLAVIEEMGKDIRPTYAGSKSSAERLKRGIVHARILVRECLMETERSARQ